MHTRSSGPPIEEFASAESEIESDIETENMAFDSENGTDDAGRRQKWGLLRQHLTQKIQNSSF